MSNEQVLIHTFICRKCCLDNKKDLKRSNNLQKGKSSNKNDQRIFDQTKKSCLGNRSKQKARSTKPKKSQI